MNSKDLFILIVFFVMLFAVLFGSGVQAQKVVLEKKVKTRIDADLTDSSVVVIETINTGHSGQNEDGLNIDSLIQVLCSDTDSKEGQMVKIISIHNGDTVIKECRSNSFDPAKFPELNHGEMEDVMIHYMQQIGVQSDSMFQWTTGFDSAVDPLNFKSFEMEWTGEMREKDSIKHQNFTFNENETGKQMLFISDNGEEIRIERNGEIVFINKNTDVDSVESEIKIIENKEGKKVIILQTTIQLAELTESEKTDLNSKGIKTGTKEPEFDYLKFYPNPSNGLVNIQFRTVKPINTEVRITNMLGKILFEEKLNDFSGEYNKSLNLSEFNKGTYLLQIAQGKKIITRKIIVD